MLRRSLPVVLAGLCLGGPAAAAPTVVTIFSGGPVPPTPVSSASIPTRGFQEITLFGWAPDLTAVLCHFTLEPAADPTTVPNVIAAITRLDPGGGMAPVDGMGTAPRLAAAPPLRVAGPFFQCRAFCFSGSTCSTPLTLKARFE